MGGDDQRVVESNSNSGMDGVEAEAQAQTGSVLPSFSQQALPGHPPGSKPQGQEGQSTEEREEGMELTRKSGKRTGRGGKRWLRASRVLGPLALLTIS